MTVLVLNRPIGIAAFPGRLVLALRQEAEPTQRLDRDGFLGGRVTSLNDLADHIEHRVAPDDPQLCALYTVASAFGDPDAWTVDDLREHQGFVWSTLGRHAGGPLPEVGDLYSDFLYAGVLDLAAAYGARAQTEPGQDGRLGALARRG